MTTVMTHQVMVVMRMICSDDDEGGDGDDANYDDDGEDSGAGDEYDILTPYYVVGSMVHRSR